MMRVFSSTIALATRATASCAVRFGLYPNDPAWKSAFRVEESPVCFRCSLAVSAVSSFVPV